MQRGCTAAPDIRLRALTEVIEYRPEGPARQLRCLIQVRRPGLVELSADHSWRSSRTPDQHGLEAARWPGG
ncbi:hypothetical protein [Streptomyces barringtoniae]|uniref:hypothetical protein n=1 Tax=Streptomyces barringtoniae TaxID=2892029 RepID=UPI001E2F9A0C|nr:hypothetical protein [Streptomyces barringtoniae]MCC5474555.1 hypothetical protein [Streptomyces barringtoniae]